MARPYRFDFTAVEKHPMDRGAEPVVHRRQPISLGGTPLHRRRQAAQQADRLSVAPAHSVEGSLLVGKKCRLEQTGEPFVGGRQHRGGAAVERLHGAVGGRGLLMAAHELDDVAFSSALIWLCTSWAAETSCSMLAYLLTSEVW